MTAAKDVANGSMDTDDHTEEEEVEEKKPGIVRKISKITFTIGPIKQEDLSTPELNKLMAMARRFDITFDTVTILDSEQTDKLGYLTLPFEIRTQEYLLVLYDRLSNLKLNPARDVSVKFPEEFKRHVEEVRTATAEARKLKLEAQKKKHVDSEEESSEEKTFSTSEEKTISTSEEKTISTERRRRKRRSHGQRLNGNVKRHERQTASVVKLLSSLLNSVELQRRSLYATYVDKDTGLDSLKEKFPDAKNITLEQHKEQWFGAMEFESQEKAIEMMKANTDLQIDEKKVKLVRNPPNREQEDKGQNRQQKKPPGGGKNMRSPRGGRGGMQSPQSLLNMGGRGGGRGGFQNRQGGGYGGGFGAGGFGGGQMMGGMGRYQDYGGGYGGGYSQQLGGPGNFQLGAKRKSDFGGDYGGSPKKPFGAQRGGYGGRGGGGWNRY